VYTEPATIPNPEDPGSPLEATIYAPSEDGGTSIAPGPFPLALFMPGFGATYGVYSAYSDHLASHGTLVIAFNFIIMPGFDGTHDYLARQATYVIDHALDGGGPLAGYVDGSRVAAAGHSLGGKISFYAASIDPRISVVMTVDPSNSGGPPCFISEEWCNAYPVAPNIVTGAEGVLDEVNAASFIMRAAPDVLLNPDEQSNAKYFFTGLDGAGLHGVKSPALYFDMGGISHASWITNPNIMRISKRTMVAWLKAYFEGEDMEAYITGAVVQVDVDAGTIAAIETR
jgi:pimeloyl-ACP methyl ester carboxylesterase